jgi:glycosyltransferase involved in cell wall biosynthesis
MTIAPMPRSLDSIPARPRIAVIIPAFNEEPSIGLVLRDMPRDWVDDIIVVDNGSTDRTAAAAIAGGARVISEPRKGYGSACLAGIAALDRETEIVVFLDADYSDDTADLPRVVESIISGDSDMIVGSRTMRADARCALTPQQRWGNWLATRLIRLFWGERFTDLGPFRAIRRSALDALGMADRDFGWTVEMQIRAARGRLRVGEVPVAYRDRVGTSKISGTVVGTVRAGYKILYTIFRWALR